MCLELASELKSSKTKAQKHFTEAVGDLWLQVSQLQKELDKETRRR